ncbi:MAG TPA: helix-turn-helix domain-containing protein [Solirubrobacterales bacterium]|nr:helix-turn-helix domain-containing protein [Solirubrobacterales bacterium]
MTRRDHSDDQGLLVALRHPVRRSLLLEMVDEEAISPRELADRLELPLSNVSYHVRVLADCGAIIEVGTKPVRGSLQHFYRATVEAAWAREVLGLRERGRRRPGESSN